MNSKLITFSGIDGAGKSTQIDHLMHSLRERQQPFIYLWSRGGYTSWFDFLKSLIRKVSGKAAPAPGHSSERDKMLGHGMIGRVWLFLAILDLMRLYGVVVRWHRLVGRVVLCDRYLWDTLIDFKINFPAINVELWFIWHLLERLCPVPDLAFFLYIPLTVSEERSLEKGDPFPEPIEKRARRHDLYMEIEKTRAKWYVIDGLKPVKEISNQIWETFCMRERHRFK